MRKRMFFQAAAAIILCTMIFGPNIAAQTPTPTPPPATIPAQKVPDVTNKLSSVEACRTAIANLADSGYDGSVVGQQVMLCGGQLISQMRADYASRTALQSEILRAYLEFFSDAENALARDKIVLPDTDIRVLNGWFQEAQSISAYLVYGIAPRPVSPSPTPQPAQIVPSPTPKPKSGHLYNY